MDIVIADATQQMTHADWLGLTDRQLEALQDDAYWLFCQEQDDPTRALRHVATIVLFEQLTALRDAVRTGMIPAAVAAAAMHRDFAKGYLFGLVASYADGCGLPRDGVHAHGAMRLLYGHTFGWLDGPKVMAEQNSRGAVVAEDDFAEGTAAATDDVQVYRDWLSGHSAPMTSGLRDGLLRRRRTGDAPALH